jgi:protein-disulfide isomerase
MPELRKTYVDNGRLRIAFRHFVLGAGAPASLPALAAECAGAQNLFWPMHDALFAAQPPTQYPQVRAASRKVGVNRGAFDLCLARGTVPRVEGDMKRARELTLSGTPTLLLGRMEPGGLRVTAVLKGLRSYRSLSRVVDRLLTAGQ